jgi:DNA-binding CsgD family transcriptional regulator
MASEPPLPDEDQKTRIRALCRRAFEVDGLLSPDGIVIHADPAALQRLDVAADAVVGKPFWLTPWWPHCVDVRKRLKSALARAGEGEWVRFLAWRPAADGTLVPMDFLFTPIYDAPGRLVGVLLEGRKLNPLNAAPPTAAENQAPSWDKRNPMQPVSDADAFIIDTAGRRMQENTFRELQKARDDLEEQVKTRTRELSDANRTLRTVVREKIKTARALKQREAELELKTGKLEDMNATLRFLLKKLDREKCEVEEALAADLRNRVQPYLRKLIDKSRQQEVRTLATILDNHLKAIVSPYCRRLTSASINLTPAELNVAHLVKAGNSTRQIAEMLNLAYKTVETHRVNIRKKLGLTRKRNNLRTCLMALDKTRT